MKYGNENITKNRRLCFCWYISLSLWLKFLLIYMYYISMIVTNY